MSAVLEVNEVSPQYLAAAQSPILSEFDLLATAPGGVARLRELILTLAVQGKLVDQDSGDTPASRLLDWSREQMRERMTSGKAKREKPAEEIEESEKHFSTPTGWQWCRLTDLGQFVNGLAFKPSDWQAEGFPIIRIQNLTGRNAEFNRTRGEFDQSVVVKAGDILVSWSATLNAFIWQGETGVLNQHIFRVEPAPCADKWFLYWLLKWAIKDLAESDHAHGLVMSHINRGPFLAKAVMLPPLAEQARIVARVDELMRLCDELEVKGKLEAAQHAQLVSTLLGTLTESSDADELAANWQRVAVHFDLLLDRPEAVDALEQSILQLAVRGLLVPQDPSDEPVSLRDGRDTSDGLPPGWSCANFGEVIDDLRYGTSVKCSYSKNGSPVLRIPNIHDGRVDIEDLKYGVLEATDIEKLKLRIDDLLVIRSNGSTALVGAGALVGAESEGFAYAGYLIRIRLKVQCISPQFSLLMMQSKDIRQQIETPLRTTSGVKNINGGEIMRLKIVIPPLAEQSRICARFKQLRHLCAEFKRILMSASETKKNLVDVLVSCSVN